MTSEKKMNCKSERNKKDVDINRIVLKLPSSYQFIEINEVMRKPLFSLQTVLSTKKCFFFHPG